MNAVIMGPMGIRRDKVSSFSLFSPSPGSSEEHGFLSVFFY